LVNIGKWDRRTVDKGYEGFMVEIKMQVYSATGDDKWKKAQVGIF
jgi:hypothetical protein